jgi:hypothetical protein
MCDHWTNKNQFMIVIPVMALFSHSDNNAYLKATSTIIAQATLIVLAGVIYL